MSSGVIYGWFDRDGACRYVGQTTEADWSRRIRGHLSATAAPTTRWEQWLREQIDAGSIPRVEVLERAEVTALTERERHWIDVYKTTVMNTAMMEPAPPRPRPQRQLPDDPCARPFVEPDPKEWAPLGALEVEPAWDSGSLRSLHVVGYGRAATVHNARRGIEVTHHAIATALARGRRDSASAVLRLAVLLDWIDRERGACREAHGGPHVPRVVIAGLALAADQARRLIKTEKPEWHYKSTVRTAAVGIFDVFHFVEGHADLTPRGLETALRAACSNYAARVIDDVFFIEAGKVPSFGLEVYVDRARVA